MSVEEKMRLSRGHKIFLAGLHLWLLAQLIRLIAIPLIISVISGVDSLGWMYPAVLDVVAAVLALPLMLALWLKRGFAVWALMIVYFTLSIVDHIGALTNLTIIGKPVAFEQFNGDENPFVAPVVQTLFDVLFMALLFLPKFRGLFFRVTDKQE